MTNIGNNLRKAAVLLRSLDSDTAAMMLAHLSSEEAAAIRREMFKLGSLDEEEQADVMAELRRTRSATGRPRSSDVELSLSSLLDETRDQRSSAHGAERSTRFEFLDSAPITALVSFLAREHAQTIAVVLSHLAPSRAAGVLSALPPKIQAETIERLSALGETDPESISALERELETWVAKRDSGRISAGRRDTMAAILAAADAKTRGQLLGNLKIHNGALAVRITPTEREATRSIPNTDSRKRPIKSPAKTYLVRQQAPRKNPEYRPPAAAPPLPRIAFDDLIHLDARSLAAVLRQADPNVLALALAGSRDELVNRICDQMPKRTARDFRRELRRLGPTRLSDVEAAQRAIAQVAARHLETRQLAASGAGL